MFQTAAAPARIRGWRTLALLGPAFVTAVAYVDPGNFATNITAGSTYGYLLVWVVIAADLMAMLIQYLSAKTGIATGRSLPELCRDTFSRPVVLGLWVQGEAIAIATDLAEVVGGAIALNLLFGLPLVAGGVITAVVAFGLLTLSTRGHRPFEVAIAGLLAVIAIGFLYDLVASGLQPLALARGTVPHFEGTDSLVLAAAMLGATVMPHAIYLHGSLTSRRYDRSTPERRQGLLRGQRIDVVVAMTAAGVMNLALLTLAASALSGTGIDTIEAAHARIGDLLGPLAALAFALTLLASGFAASSVGTLAGQVLMDGFLQRRVPLVVRRLVTLLPALVVLGLGADPTRALVVSQVVLSFGIPFALVPLIVFTARTSLMGTLVNRRSTTVVASAVAALIIALNALVVIQAI